MRLSWSLFSVYISKQVKVGYVQTADPLTATTDMLGVNPGARVAPGEITTQASKVPESSNTV